MAIWTVKNYKMRDCDEVVYLTREPEGDNIQIIVQYERIEYLVETNNENIPEFKFTRFPNGDTKIDSIILNGSPAGNIIRTEVKELVSPGSAYALVDSLDYPETKYIKTLIDSERIYGIASLIDGSEANPCIFAPWTLVSEETEHWIWGPVQITNDQGFSKIIYADENGNIFDYKENTPQ